MLAAGLAAWEAGGGQITLGLLLTELATPLILLPWLSLPLAILLVRSLARREGTALNPVLARTGGLLTVFGVLFTVAIVLSG